MFEMIEALERHAPCSPSAYSRCVSVFADLANDVRLPLRDETTAGFRAAQLAAIHAVVGHFWNTSRPGLVVMPTGAGKTAVMMATSVLLRATRVLVVAPSRLLREQLADGFARLDDMHAVGALKAGGVVPRVEEVRRKLSTKKSWAALVRKDVVVGTPASLSPGIDGVFVPPTDLFDTVIFDEAHHVPARTYNAIAEAFPSARQILFTATPFRRDERQIQADLIFTYELAQARRDGVFGKLHYEAVDPRKGESGDEAIARAAAARLNADRAKGFDHRLVVRASSRERADELAELYKRSTKLELRRLHSGLSSAFVRKAVEELRAGEIDGVVAVDMLGEGFDLPQLKVAALHAPHRSLAVTLQFIGRFARTTAPNLGQATFFALPHDVEHEAESGKLFVPGAEWNEIVEDLSQQRLAAEQAIREAVSSFEPVVGAEAHAPESRERQRALLWALRPYFHAKVYEAVNAVDLDADLDVPSDLEPVLIQRSAKERSVLWVGRTRTPLRWSRAEAWADVTYDMFLIVHAPAERLVFICTSRRHNAVYDDLIASITHDARRLAPAEVSRALRGVSNQELFSVGMRNRAAIGGAGAESYRILTGRSAGNAIRAVDAGLYDQGHVFCRGTENGQDVTLGYSSASKVWTNRWDTIPELLRWLRALAQKIHDSRVLAPQSMFDRLGKATRLSTLPAPVIAADLPAIAYDRYATQISAAGKRAFLIDFAIAVGAQKESTAELVLRAGKLELPFAYDLATRPCLTPMTDEAAAAMLVDGTGRHEESLTAFLNESPPTLFLQDLSQVIGDTMSAAPAGAALEPGRIEAVDWATLRVDPFREKPPPAKRNVRRKLSLFEYIERRARAENVDVLFTDDASNEIADYVTVRRDQAQVLVQLIHCKAAKDDPVPGDRVKDLYEVLGQAVKCRRWLDRRRLLAQVRHRIGNTGSRFIIGNFNQLSTLLDDASRLTFEVVVVQPALSTQPKETIVDLLAAVDAYQRGAERRPIKLIGTAPGTQRHR